MNDDVFIIAEAGVNHNGNINLAYKMVDAAVEAKVNAIKFQTFKADNVVSKFANKAEYQKNNTASEESQLEMVKKLELSFEDFKRLKEYCDNKGIIFLSTGFDFESLDFLKGLGMNIFKIPSGEITNLPYLMKVAKLGGKIVISTGMSNEEEIDFALKILRENGANDITVLHCNTEYPTPIEDVNLRAMVTIKEKFGVDVGYSDHTLGIEVPIAATAMGATIIEKHFTLDKDMDGPDHKASVEPKELNEMVLKIRNISKALGSGEKVASKSEEKNKNIARRSIVAKRNIKKGEIFNEDNITLKRPGGGISPIYWFNVLGTKANKDFQEDEQIKL